MPTFEKSSIDEARVESGRAPSLTLALPAVAVIWLASSGAAALAPGDAPPAIDAVDQDGQKVELDELVGRVVLVDFWASWCRPCRQELPVLEALHRELGSQGLVVIGVNIDRTKKKMVNFLRSTPLSFRLVHDPKLTIAASYEPPTMPSSYLVGRDGKIRYVHEGFRKGDGAALEARIKALLSEGERPDGD